MKLLRSLAPAMTAVAMVLGVFVPMTAQAVGNVQNAQNPFTRTDNGSQAMNTVIQQRAGFGNTVKSLPEIIGNIINIVLSFLGVLLLVYLIYAGFLWMTSGGESKKSDEAQKIIKNAVIGLIIILASFAISNFVISQLTAIQG